MRLAGKVAVITGTSPNIGGGIAEALAAEGAAVRVSRLDRPRTPTTGGGAARVGRARDRDHGGHHRRAMVEGAFARVASELGPVDVLVNNAATFNKKGVLDMPIAEWSRQLAVILDGAFLCTAAAARRDGRAQAGRRDRQRDLDRGASGEPRNVGYCTAKAGLLNFTRSVAMELAPHGIRVNSLTPTATDPSESLDRAERWGRKRPSERVVQVFEPFRRASRCSGCRRRATTDAPWSTSRRTMRAASTGTDLRVDAGAVARYWAWNPDPERRSEMFDLTVSEEGTALVELVHAFAERELRGAARDAEQARAVPAAAADALHALGVTCPIPEALGGQGEPDLISYLMVVEELAWGDPSIAYAALGAGHAALLVAQCGTREQQQVLLPRFLASQPPSAAVWLHEGFGRAPSELRTRAERTASGWTLSGAKSGGAASRRGRAHDRDRAPLRHECARRVRVVGEPSARA
jgi:NAD(P)-dependent dehydrogenase (short-subunit alcohol dehydrogenase family)